MDTDTHTNQVDETQVDHRISFDEFLTNAAALFDEAAAGVRVTVEHGGQLFRVAPVRRSDKKPKRRFTKNDALWDIVGMINSGGPGDIAEHKHEYLAEAYADLHEPDGTKDEQAPSAGAMIDPLAERQ